MQIIYNSYKGKTYLGNWYGIIGLIIVQQYLNLFNSDDLRYIL